MRLWEVFRFEIAYQGRRSSTWIYFGVLAGLVFLMINEMMVQEARSGNVHANAPFLIAFATIMISMLGLVITAALFGDAGARDAESRIHPLFFTAPLTKAEYLGGRFLAAFTLNSVMLSIVPAGMILAEMSNSDSGVYGPFRLVAYLQPYLLFAIPNLVLSGAVLFAMAALTRRPLASYGGGVLLFFASLLTEEGLAESMSKGKLAALVDPFGFTAMSEIIEYWTPAERNVQLVGLEGLLLWNRVIWLAVAAVMLAALYVRFRFVQEREPARRRGDAEPTIIEAMRDRPAAVVVPQTRRAFGLSARLQQAVAVARQSFGEVVRRGEALAVVALTLVFIFIAGWDAWNVLETPSWPMTYVIARAVLGGMIPLIYLLIGLYAGELVWRERDTAANEITDTAPVPNWVLLAGKFGALLVSLIAFQAVLIGGGVLLQAAQGFYQFELSLYAKILFGIQLPDYILWGALAMLVHVVVNQKYIGHLIFVLYFMFRVFGRYFTDFGPEHNLLVYPGAPQWTYSDMSGFGPSLAPYLWFKLYWAAWAVVFAILANLFWVRGRDVEVWRRLRGARLRFTPAVARASALAAAAVLFTGGFVFYNTNVLNDYRSRDERTALRVDYERAYKRYEDIPQPRIRRTELRVEIYPDRHTAEIDGTYHLVNAHSKPVDSVHVLLRPEVDTRSIRFDRAAEPALQHDEHGYRIYRLAQPLEPGEPLQMTFHMTIAQRGFTNSGARATVVRNGTYFGRDWLPIIGYQPDRELLNERLRKEHGLPPRKRLPPIDDEKGLRTAFSPNDAEWVELETVIGTDRREIAVTTGSLRRTWTENGRRYFHYATDAPIQNNYAIHSSEYNVVNDRWNGVDIQILHHPRHAFNIDRMRRSIKASLAYHTENFGPYPHRQLRIIEFPRHAGNYARAYPNTIAYSEAFGFVARAEDGIDYPLLVTAHEVSHQWWGNQLRPARVEGGPVLAETLAHYGAMMVMEKTYGSDEVRRLARILMHQYLIGRQNRRGSEVPLLLSNDQKYIHYDKGGVVMYALRDYIGEERVNTALRRVFEKHRFGDAPYPTTRELYAELQAVTPEPLQYLLEDLIEDITLWDFRTTEARAEPAGGAYRVTLTIEAAKLKSDSVGRDTPVPMNDLVDIGVFAAPEEGQQEGEILYLQKHRIRSGEQTISITVPREPARAGIDPHRKLIERQPADNIRTITRG